VSSTKEKVRLIIPLWGAVYANKLVSITLPALLASNNLPALCGICDVEVVLVTETKLFNYIRAAESFKRVSDLCPAKLVPIDDLLTDLPGDYGVVLTYALFRGFADLGARMTETYLVFLNADFIISDGSLRHVGELIAKGARVIHAPSFRVVLEDVRPQLESRIDPATAALSIKSREMVKLALAHKHLTLRARIVNQRLCHQWRMDQFYWYVDEDTLIGYQWPVALVAIKPERVVTEPLLVWDYAFVPEAAPSVEKHFIDDSDDFFMLELQQRTSGNDMVRLGWISIDDIAKDLSKWTTKEQRHCGQQLLKFHANDLPPDMGNVVQESRDYMARIVRRLSRTPQPHGGHAMLSQWFESVKERINIRAASLNRPDTLGSVEATPYQGPTKLEGGPRRSSINKMTLKLLESIYTAAFGRLPVVSKHHPLWTDTHTVAEHIAAWKQRQVRILWLASDDSMFHKQLRNRIDPAAILLDIRDAVGDYGPYDACLCELTIDELADLRNYYIRLRPLMADGAEVVVYVFNKNLRTLQSNDASFYEQALPDMDLSEIRFFGSPATAAYRRLYLLALDSSPIRPVLRGLLTALALIVFAPVVRLANALAARRNPEIFSPTWTSLVINFRIKKEHRPAHETAAARAITAG